MLIDHKKNDESLSVKEVLSDSERDTLLESGEPIFASALGNVSYLTDLEELPQGRHLGVFSTLVLLVSRIVGSGIFATPALIYNDVGGSPVLFFLVWGLAGLMAFAGLYVYLEMGSIVPRSGGIKVFVEFIYYKPAMLTSVVISIYSVLFGFAISNTLVFGQYFLYSIGVDDAGEATGRYVGIVLLILVTVIHGTSIRYGVLAQNYIGSLKLFLLVVLSLTGLYVTLFPSSITGIESQLFLHNKVNGKVSIASVSAAFMKATFSLGGWNSAHTVTSEIKNPDRTLRIAGPLSLVVVLISYLLINLAYLVVIPHVELSKSGQLVGSLLFEKLFGYRIGRQFLTFSISACAAGNVFVVLYGVSRMNQEVFREGFLPFSHFFAANIPFGAPLPALSIPFVITCGFLLFKTPGNIYNYVVNLESYPQQIFLAFLAVGLIIVRRRKCESSMRAPYWAIAFIMALSVFLSVGPLVPSEENPFPNYAHTGLFLMGLCALYWVVMFKLLPYVYGYELVENHKVLEDGLVVKQWDKQYYV